MLAEARRRHPELEFVQADAEQLRLTDGAGGGWFFFFFSFRLCSSTIAKFQRELGAMGYQFQFITLAGWHLISHHTFDLRRAPMPKRNAGLRRLQAQEFANEQHGYTATKHQREAGTGYFDRS